MEAPEQDTERLNPDEAGEAAPDDERGAKPPSEGADRSRDRAGTRAPGNPAQDEESLSHEQQDSG